MKASEKKIKEKNIENVDPSEMQLDVPTPNTASKKGVKRKAASMKEDKPSGEKKEIIKSVKRKASFNPINGDGNTPIAPKPSNAVSSSKNAGKGGKKDSSFVKDPSFQFIKVDFSDDEFKSRL